MVCEHTSLRHFDGGKFFISQISSKGKREVFFDILKRLCYPVSVEICAKGGAAHGFCTMLGIYCFYRMGLGVKKPVLWADILNYYITMYFGWKVGLRALWQSPAPILAVPAALALGACALFFVSAAVLPPENYPMFMEERQNGRDQRTGTS